jgi:hypothetical protein
MATISHRPPEVWRDVVKESFCISANHVILQILQFRWQTRGGGRGVMKFPVFLLGLLASSGGVGIVLWLGGTSVGMSLVWAIVAFMLGQVLYVLLIAAMAGGESRTRPALSANPEPGKSPSTAQGLAPGPDRRG